MRYALVILLLIASASAQVVEHAPLKGAHHGHLKSGDVNLHYVALGKKGPLVVLLHGFPDFWWTWRQLMPALATDHHVVAIDLRGYNLSDKPAGTKPYAMRTLIGDVAATIRHFGHDKATVIGHDWGGAIAWQVAMWRPDLVEKLVILNIPHPTGMARELLRNPQQHANSKYARDFQEEGAHEKLTAAGLAKWVKDAKLRPAYERAFERSDFRAMLAYYKANFPRPVANAGSRKPPPPPARQVKCPTLVIHGLEDKALLAGGLNDTWEWVEAELTITTIPGAGHFVQHDAPKKVRRTIGSWLRKGGRVAQTSTAMSKLVNPKCPFSGRPVEPHSLTRHAGKVVGFCNQGCRDKFARDPAKYLALIPELDH